MLHTCSKWQGSVEAGAHYLDVNCRDYIGKEPET